MTGAENSTELLKILMKTEVIEKVKKEMDRHLGAHRGLGWYQDGEELMKLQCTFGDLKQKSVLVTVLYSDIASVFIEFTPWNSSQWAQSE